MSFAFDFSRSASTLTPSPIRELFKLTQAPGMISFAGGLPDPEVFPVEVFAECADILRTDGRSTLQYSASEGWPPLVDILRRRMSDRTGRPVSGDQILVTSGSQQVMDLLARVLIDSGDAVVVEGPSYPGALHSFRAAGARFVTVPCDDCGMKVDLLPDAIDRCTHESGAPPKLIYTIVNFSNPSGACLAASRRRELVRIAHERRIPIFEDDPYGDLRFTGSSIPSVFEIAQGEGVVFASSFSKILAPGVRVAWAVGAAEVIRKMVIAKQGVDLCSSTVTQALVAEYCHRGYLEAHLPAIRHHYAAKARLMADALHRHVGGSASWHDPEGGFFFWLRLPTDGDELFTNAVRLGVAILPGRAFFPDQREIVGEIPESTRFARLCFTFPPNDAIDEGCKRLARALAQTIR